MFRRKNKVRGNDELALKLATLSDTAFIFSHDEVAHELEFHSIAEIARLNERVKQLEGIILGIYE